LEVLVELLVKDFFLMITMNQEEKINKVVL